MKPLKIFAFVIAIILFFLQFIGIFMGVGIASSIKLDIFAIILTASIWFILSIFALIFVYDSLEKDEWGWYFALTFTNILIIPIIFYYLIIRRRGY